MIPRALPLNRLTVGRHMQTVALAGRRRERGQVHEHVRDHDLVRRPRHGARPVRGQWAADDAERCDGRGRNGSAARNPFGFRAGQTLVLDTGDNQETVTIATAPTPPPTVNTTLSAAAAAGATAVRLANYTTATTGGPNAPTVNGPSRPADRARHGREPGGHLGRRHIVPVPPAPEPNVILTAPLTKDHAAGTATSLANVILSAPLTKAHASGSRPSTRGRSSPAVAARSLKALLAQARRRRATAGNTARRSTWHGGDSSSTPSRETPTSRAAKSRRRR